MYIVSQSSYAMLTLHTAKALIRNWRPGQMEVNKLGDHKYNLSKLGEGARSEKPHRKSWNSKST